MIAVRRARRPGRRSGAATLEMMFAIMVLVMLTLGVVEYGILMLVRHTVGQAVTIAAREAAKKNNVTDAGTVAYSNFLGVMATVHSRFATGGSGDFFLRLEYGGSPDQTFGNPAYAAPSPAIAMQATDVRVTVGVNMTGGPLINALSAFGLSHAGKVFRTTAVTQKE